MYAAFTAGPLIAAEMTGSRATSGLPGATAILGTAAGSALLTNIMARRGRRSGLRYGYSIGLVGAVWTLVVTGADAGFILFVAGMFVLGIGHAANQLSRFAAADMHEADRRGPVLGWVVWAGSIGALLGPPLLRVGAPIAESVELPQLTGALMFAALFYLAALVTVLAMRTDPSDIVVDDVAVAEVDPARARLGTLLRLPHVRLALTVMIVGQAAMVLVMTMTPIHVREHGHGLGVLGGIMTAHFMGMFALAPFIGKMVARWGAPAVILSGLALLTAGAVGAALSPETSGPLLALSLYVVGLGWCLGFISSSVLLTQGLVYAERVRVQGSVDALAWLSSAAASIGSGFLLAGFGFTTLCFVAAIGAIAAMFFVAVRREVAVVASAA